MHGERHRLSVRSILGTHRTCAVSLVAFMAASLLSIGIARADALVNPGFETGDLTGWTPFGPVSVVDHLDTVFSGTVDPCCGDSHHFAVLQGSDVGTSLSQTVLNMAAGQDISLAFRYVADGLVSGDANITVSGPGGTDTLFDQPGGSFVDTLWTPLDYKVPVAGDYTISFFIQQTSLGFASYPMVDAPEPAGIALIAVGLAALGLVRRRGR